MTRVAAWVEDQRPWDTSALEVKHLKWWRRGNPLESLRREAVNAMRLLPGSVSGTLSLLMPKQVLPVVALLGREKEQQPSASAGEAGPCMLVPPLCSRVLCCWLDPTDAACKVGAAYPGAREKSQITDPWWQSGDKTGPGHACGKSGVEKQTASSSTR